jgi:hypothetical protein
MDDVTRRDALRLAAVGVGVTAAAAVAGGQEKAEQPKVEHDVGKLEAQIGELRKTMTQMAEPKDLDELIKIIHRPGWTTPAEFLFATGIVEAMTGHVRALGVLKQTLIKGSQAVAAK